MRRHKHWGAVTKYKINWDILKFLLLLSFKSMLFIYIYYICVYDYYSVEGILYKGTI